MGDLRLDTTTWEVLRQGVVIDLTTKECRLLEYLMRHPNQILTSTMIAEHVWNYEFNNATNVRYPQKVCKQSGGVPSL